MVELLLIREAIALTGSALAAWSDKKTGLIFDEITVPMILFGAIFNLAERNIYAFAIATIVFALGYLLYFSGKIGGGDVKLFSGLALLVPFLDGKIFVLNVFVISGFIAVVFLSVYYVLKYAKKGINLNENVESIKKAAVFSLVLIIYFYFLLSAGMLSEKFALFVGVPSVFAILFLSLEHGIKKNFFLKKIPLNKIEEDDLIASEFLDENTKKALSLNFKGIIDVKTKKKLHELKVKEVLVYRNLPKFAPFVFAGVIVSILFPDFLFWVFS
ncbi:MAG: prepilin peptidase [Candidatus Diapherotrites archaeon]|nr:prepilin peptidase [Candidatus Diapherotrites archaeon]